MTVAEFDPRHSIDQAFLLLSSRLEPIIAATLAPHLGGLAWTAILEERDRIRGRAVGVYEAADPQSQLKVLTERLGALGFPFDDSSRTVSVLGGELRIVRNRWAHHGELTALDAWRTSDFVVRLLARLHDEDGESSALQLREAAFKAVAEEKGIAAHAQPVSRTDVSAPIADASFGIAGAGGGFSLTSPPAPAPTLDFNADAEDAQAEPNSSEGKSDDSDLYESWTVVPVGDSGVIDDLPKKAAKERVRAVAAEIIDFEGPIQVQRLAQLTAASFGVMRLHEKREKKISYQIQQIEGITVDAHKFVWPNGVNPATWRGFRRTDPAQGRDFLAISPVEIANAIRFVGGNDSASGDAEIERAVIKLFGKSRLTPAFRAHLSKAWQRV